MVVVNGLYASSNGEGGITRIETTRIPTANKLQLELTGSQGDVMKESMMVAKSLGKLHDDPQPKEWNDNYDAVK